MNKPNQDVIEFNLTDVAIFELVQEYMPLKINGLDDKEGAKAVSAARKIVKGYRVDVDKRRKKLNADALEWQRKINSEAKRITAMLEPIESHLESEEKRINEEVERIKREKEEAEQQRNNLRVSKLLSIRFKYSGSHFYTEYLDTFTNQKIEVSNLHLKQMTDSEFNDFFDNAKHYCDIEEKAIVERMIKEEAERKALAEERARLDAIAKEQAEKESALKQEAERIESLKKYEESKLAVINSEVECKENGCEAPIHTRPTIVITKDNVKVEDGRECRKDFMFWEGFDACLEMVFNSLDNYDSNELAKFSVYDFIEDFREHLIEESELYKKDG